MVSQFDYWKRQVRRIGAAEAAIGFARVQVVPVESNNLIGAAEGPVLSRVASLVTSQPEGDARLCL